MPEVFDDLFVEVRLSQTDEIIEEWNQLLHRDPVQRVIRKGDISE